MKIDQTRLNLVLSARAWLAQGGHQRISNSAADLRQFDAGWKYSPITNDNSRGQGIDESSYDYLKGKKR